MRSVLHVIDTAGAGGAETVFLNLVKEMRGNDFVPVVVIKGPGWLHEELVKIGLEPIHINPSGSFNFKYLYGLTKVVLRNKINLIHSHLLGANVYCGICGFVCNTPVIATFHGFMDVKDNEPFLFFKTKIINHTCSAIVFVSDQLRRHYISKMGFTPRKSVTIQNGIDLNNFNADVGNKAALKLKLGFEPSDILIGAVGNIRPSKSYDIFLKAAKILSVASEKFKFVVVGEGNKGFSQPFLDLRNELGLGAKVFWLGFEPNVADVLKGLDIFVSTSVSEGFSISTIEAMASGLPVVVTRSGGPEDIIQHGWDGLLVPPGLPSEVADAVLLLTHDPDLKQKIRSNAPQTAKKYSIHRTLDNYLDLYERLTK